MSAGLGDPDNLAVYRQPLLTTHDHKIYVNPNRAIREFYRETVDRTSLRDFKLIIREQELCRGQLESGLIYVVIS